MRAIVLAGGKGTRLAPYTTVLPKPLMPIGDVPILEVVLRQLVAHGFADVTLAVGYLAELLIAYCGDGSKFGMSIAYSKEATPLGTAGPMGLVEGIDSTFLVMNGDLLTTLDYSKMLADHRKRGAIATVATFQREVQIDLGILKVAEDGSVVDYLEKPKLNHLVSMGIYIFEPSILRYVPKGQKLDLPDLIMSLLAAGERVASHRHTGYWLDIGRHDDYAQATAEFEANRRAFLPET